ncbi:MAG: hypothetical protein EXR73_01250 [Myxococcales bacterium]|nr:hypothetical protein [Myxococcales bacterium]
MQIFDIATGASVLTINGTFTGEQFGAAIAYVGDINADGVGDWAIGGPFNGVIGTDGGRCSIHSGLNGAQLRIVRGAAGDLLGTAISVARDSNADGVVELLIGTPGFGAGDEGRLLLVSGKSVAVLASFDGASAGAEFGRVVASAESGNGDGHADLLGAWAGCKRVDLVSGANSALMKPIAPPLFARTLATASGALALLDGDGPGSLVAIGAPDDATGEANAGALSLQKLDDLYLQITPEIALDTATVSAIVRGGPSGAAFCLVLEEIDGTVVNTLLALAVPDANGADATSDTVPPGMAGIVWGLRSFAIGFDGKVVDTALETLTFE